MENVFTIPQLDGGHGDLDPELERTTRGTFMQGVSQGRRERSTRGQFKKGVSQGEGGYHCSVGDCDYQFKHQRSLTIHLSTVHSVHADPEDRFPGRKRTCPQESCRLQFMFRSKLMGHLISKHKMDESAAEVQVVLAKEVFPKFF